MAIFHFSAKFVCRSKGQNAVAKAAYNAREKLTNEETGLIYDYRRKGGVLFEGIFTPKDAPAWARERQSLWAEVERTENRKNSQVAREFQIALPHELSEPQRTNLIKDFVRENFVRHGMVADVVLHTPGTEGDERNFHAHVLTTTRAIGPDGFASHKLRHLEGREQLEQWRENWERLANRYLERFGHEARIDRRSLAAQGIEREPTVHVGPTATQFEREGGRTERGDINRSIAARNMRREELRTEFDRIEAALLPGAETAQARRREKAAQENGAMSEQTEMTDEDRRREEIKKKDAARQKAITKDEESRKTTIAEDAEKRDKAIAEENERRDKAIAEDEERRQEAIREDERQRQEAFKEAATREAAQLRELEAQERAFVEYRAQRSREAEQTIREEKESQRQEAFKGAGARDAEQQREMDEREQGFAEFRAQKSQEIEQRIREEEQRRLADAQALQIRAAGSRYGQALVKHYDPKDHYGSMSRAAMEEYRLLLQDQERLNDQIAHAKDPKEREALLLRKRIEGNEYMAATSERIANQSEIIVGRLNTTEAKHRRELAAAYRFEAQELREQFHIVQASRSEAAHEKIYGKHQEQEKGEDGAEPVPKQPTPRAQTGRARYQDIDCEKDAREAWQGAGNMAGVSRRLEERGYVLAHDEKGVYDFTVEAGQPKIAAVARNGYAYRLDPARVGAEKEAYTERIREIKPDAMPSLQEARARQRDIRENAKPGRQAAGPEKAGDELAEERRRNSEERQAMRGETGQQRGADDKARPRRTEREKAAAERAAMREELGGRSDAGRGDGGERERDRD